MDELLSGALQVLGKKGTRLPVRTQLITECGRRFLQPVLFRSLSTANIFLCCEMMADLELLQQPFAFLSKISMVHL